MSNCPADKRGPISERQECVGHSPCNMLHSPAINGSSGHMVECQSCVDVIDGVQNLGSKENAIEGVEERVTW